MLASLGIWEIVGLLLAAILLIYIVLFIFIGRFIFRTHKSIDRAFSDSFDDRINKHYDRIEEMRGRKQMTDQDIKKMKQDLKDKGYL